MGAMLPYFLLVLIPTSCAVTCRDWVLTPNHTSSASNTIKTCEGDYCIVAGTQAEPIGYQRCLSGVEFSRFNGFCWANHAYSICVCNTTLCNDNAKLPATAPGHLKCGNTSKSQNCFACESTIRDDILPIVNGCSNTEMLSVHDLMRPQSCVRVQTDTVARGYMRCWCNTTDYCSDALLRLQTLKSEKVTCRVGAGDDGTCKGDFCLTERVIDASLEPPILVRGCLTNNETLYPGLYKIGSMKSINREIVICNTTLCNANSSSTTGTNTGTFTPTKPVTGSTSTTTSGVTGTPSKPVTVSTPTTTSGVTGTITPTKPVIGSPSTTTSGVTGTITPTKPVTGSTPTTTSGVTGTITPTKPVTGSTPTTTSGVTGTSSSSKPVTVSTSIITSGPSKPVTGPTSTTASGITGNSTPSNQTSASTLTPRRASFDDELGKLFEVIKAALGVFSCLPLTFAVKCREKIFGLPEVYMNDDYETKTCDGDFCIVGGSLYESRSFQLCLNGAGFAGFNDKCWNNELMSYCVCNTDYCHDKIRLPIPGKGNLTCGKPPKNSATSLTVNGVPTSPNMLNTDNCFTCEVSQCDRSFMNEIEDLLQPQSCVRIQSSSSGGTHCVCDTGDYCGEQLAEEQILNAETVTCFLGSNGNETCKGQFCFIERGPTIITSKYDEFRIRKGCITNNETLFAGLYQVGYMRTILKEFIICNSDMCNADWDTASRSVPALSTTTVQTTSSSGLSKEGLFEIEYMKLFRSIKSALDTFINRYAEIQG